MSWTLSMREFATETKIVKDDEGMQFRLNQTFLRRIRATICQRDQLVKAAAHFLECLDVEQPGPAQLRLKKLIDKARRPR